MSFIKCFDVASMVIDDATERFKPTMRLNTEKVDIFRDYCDAIDTLSNEFEGEAFDIEVDEITMEITVALECDEIVIESSKHIFYELVKRAVKYSFSTSEDGNLIVKFVFPCLWDKA